MEIIIPYLILLAPSVERLRALRVNDTAFNFTLEVFYTGGGDLEQFIIQLQQGGSGTFTTLTTVTPIQSQTSPRLWYAVVDDPDVFDGLEDPQFNVNIVNAMGQSVTTAASGESGKLYIKISTISMIDVQSVNPNIQL